MSERDPERENIERYLWMLERSTPEESAFVDISYDFAVVGTCKTGMRGTWAFELESLEYDARRARWDGRWVLGHYDSQGARTFLIPTTSDGPYGPNATGQNCCNGFGVHYTSKPLFFDFDGDGDDEVYFRNTESGHEGHHVDFPYLLTFRGGSIVPFAESSTITDVFDVDGDSVPDLVTDFGYTWSHDSCGSGFTQIGERPSLALRYGEGRFRIDDESKALLASWCPASPRSIESRFDALCARLWAKDSELGALRRRVAASCVPWSCDAENHPRPQAANARPDCAGRLQWFDRSPPFRLTSPSPNACRRNPPKGSRTGPIYEGEFLRSRDDSESGFAHVVRYYCFRPLRSWRGIASAEERCEAFFLPGDAEANTMPSGPVFSPGTRVLVETVIGGPSGEMTFLEPFSKPSVDGADRIYELGKPCWDPAPDRAGREGK